MVLRLPADADLIIVQSCPDIVAGSAIIISKYLIAVACAGIIDIAVAGFILIQPEVNAGLPRMLIGAAGAAEPVIEAVAVGRG